MAAESAFARLLKKNSIELSAMQGKSSNWFRSQVRQMAGVAELRPTQIMRGDASSKGTEIIPGNLYMYVYDPKHKETLPYYDTFPMVFPFRQVKDGFYGLNLHYLPYDLRAVLLDRLLEFRNNKFMDETTRLKMSWGTISGMSKFALAQPCVKHYLYQHVKSPFKAVHPQDWATALTLPLQRFAKATPQQVWRDSARKSRGM